VKTRPLAQAAIPGSTRIPQLTLANFMSEGQTWNSEDIRLYGFTVFFGPWQAVVMKAGRLEAVTHWLRYGRFVPRF
jgi:hypothetical protein